MGLEHKYEKTMTWQMVLLVLFFSPPLPAIPASLFCTEVAHKETALGGCTWIIYYMSALSAMDFDWPVPASAVDAAEFVAYCAT
jgi:hypothetical protein